MSSSESASLADGSAESTPLSSLVHAGELGHEGELRHLVGLSRLVAPNPSVMTGPGTNSYILGSEVRAIVDPGPEDAAHLERLLRLGGDQLAFVLVTHHHRDHAPLGRILADRAGVPLLAFGHASSPEPDRRLLDGDLLDLGDLSIRVLHTPGHASDHCCFLVDASDAAVSWAGAMLLTGDHVMSGSTVVIAPLDGDMSDYIQSLRRLIGLDIGEFSIAPGHGGIIDDGASKLRSYLDHRLSREQMVEDALSKGPATPQELVPLIYQRLAKSLRGPAASSVWAHLRRLAGLGRASSAAPDDPFARWEAAS
jgi:glyoxylase-like metal-dependent hydrolase (beta-lactamase superfamily II)